MTATRSNPAHHLYKVCNVSSSHAMGQSARSLRPRPADHKRPDRQSFRSELRQWEQPEPQPPAWASGAASPSAPSSTWKECPQPHEEAAFGLSILKPDSWRPVRKSIVAPWRYGTLKGSTTTLTPSSTSSRSPSAASVSNPSPYWKPEQPPPWIATRRTSEPASGSDAISSLTFSAASGVRS